MTTLGELRIALAEARIALRQAKDAHEVSRAIAETAAIERLNGNAGKNEAERSRNLTIELLHDNAYSNVLMLLRDAEAKIDRLSAEIAVQEDQLSQHRLAEREHNDRAIERLAIALEKLGGAPAGVLSRIADIPF